MKNLWMGLMVVSLLSMIGCIDYEEKLVINEDGSGTVELMYAMDKTYMNQLQQSSVEMAKAMGQEAPEEEDPSPQMFDSSKIDEALKLSNTGMTMLSFESVETDSTVKVKMKCGFEDINKLYFLYGALFPDEIGDTSIAQEQADIFKPGANGDWVFHRPLSDDDESAENDEYAGTEDEYHDHDDGEDDETSMAEGMAELSEYLKDADLGDMDKEAMANAMQGMQAQMRGMEKRMAKHSIKFTIVFPGSIKESNATSADGNTAVWSFGLKEFSNSGLKLKAVISR